MRRASIRSSTEPTRTTRQSYPDYLDLRDRNRSFDALAPIPSFTVGLDTGKNPSRSMGYEASGNYFDALGIQPYLGRFFHGADEHGPNSAPYHRAQLRLLAQPFSG